MSRPPGVADADLTRNGIFFDLLSQIGNASNGFSDINMPRLKQRYSCGIISSVFQAAQAIEKDRKGIRGSYVSNNSTHKSNVTTVCLSRKLHGAMTVQPSSSFKSDTLAIIMGGGAGTRLFPLTKERSKPAVPLGGKYRLVDIPISNCLNSSLRGIYILTQFNSASLHSHINESYKFDNFTPSFVEILAAQQTPEGARWYQGTADAVRQNMRYFLEHRCKYFIILSGDQLYRMDYREMIRQHIDSGADLTIGTIPVERKAVPGFGIMATDSERRITRFVEKPKDPAVIDSLRIPGELLGQIGHSPEEELFQASMGIYVFNREALISSLDNDLVDFGKNIIPAAIEHRKVMAHIFEGYWEDIGTIRSFFDANLEMADRNPKFSFYVAGAPVYSQPLCLPASVIEGAHLKRAMISDGCVLGDATLERCVLGIRSIVGSGSTMKNTVMMGADLYESPKDERPAGVPPIGVGANCSIEGAIIDKNARIGTGVVITSKSESENFDGDGYYIRDGIVVVPKNSVIPDGTRI
jgi:glucose-1-phosphate adenylyltransferase